METEVLVESLGWILWCFVNIKNLPSLVGSVVSSIGNNSGSFSIFASSNIKAFSILEVDEVFTFILEDLPPSRVGAPDLHVLSSS